MTTTEDIAAAAPRLDDKQLGELLTLTRDADSVELKLTVSEEHRYSTLTALGIDPLDAYIRQVFFFDTDDLALDARRNRRKGAPEPGTAR